MASMERRGQATLLTSTVDSPGSILRQKHGYRVLICRRIVIEEQADTVGRFVQGISRDRFVTMNYRHNDATIEVG